MRPKIQTVEGKIGSLTCYNSAYKVQTYDQKCSVISKDGDSG